MSSIKRTPEEDDAASPRANFDDVAFVIDRHRLFAEAVTPLLEDLGFRVSVATTAETAFGFISLRCPKLTLVDLTLPAEDGFFLGQQALAARDDAIVIGITSMADPRRVKESRRAGFWGCLSKDISMSRFTSHIRAAAQGRPILQPRHGVERRRYHHSGSLGLLAPQLTSREVDVLTLLVEGATGGRIASELAISPNTVRTHVQSILTKLQVHSRLEAAAVAVRQGLVPDRTTEPGAA